MPHLQILRATYCRAVMPIKASRLGRSAVDDVPEPATVLDVEARGVVGQLSQLLIDNARVQRGGGGHGCSPFALAMAARATFVTSPSGLSLSSCRRIISSSAASRSGAAATRR